MTKSKYVIIEIPLRCHHHQNGISSVSDFTLYIGRHGALLWHPRWRPEPLAAAEPSRAHELAAVLTGAKHCGVALIADDSAQEIRVERLPRLGRFDRARLLQRRLAQSFPGSVLAVCLGLRRAGEQDAACFAHLPETSQVHAWLRWLKALPNPRRGVYLSGDLCARVAAALACKDLPPWTHIFVVTPEGLRQATLHDGQPVLTRLIAVADKDGAAIGAATGCALREARDYLARHGWQSGTEEQAIVLLPPEAETEAAKTLPRDILLLPYAKTAAWLGLPHAAPDGLRLLAAAREKFRRKLSVMHLPEDIAEARHRMIARGGWAVAAAVTLIFASLSGASLYDAHDARRAASAEIAEQNAVKLAIRKIEQDMSGDLALRTRMRHAQMLRDASAAPAPWTVLQALETAMPAQIRLGAFDWHAAARGAETKLTLRLMPMATEKDPAQKEALKLYQDFADALRTVLPRAEVKAALAPYALDAAHRFNDPAMLKRLAGPWPTAMLDVREP